MCRYEQMLGKTARMMCTATPLIKQLSIFVVRTYPQLIMHRCVPHSKGTAKYQMKMQFVVFISKTTNPLYRVKTVRLISGHIFCLKYFAFHSSFNNNSYLCVIWSTNFKWNFKYHISPKTVQDINCFVCTDRRTC
jgi:hypothetical protein